MTDDPTTPPGPVPPPGPPPGPPPAGDPSRDEPSAAGPPPASDPPPTAEPPPASDPPPTAEPPGGGSAWGPPPGAFTQRYGLVRPRQGRYLAGVCGAIGRATNTDPVLWRVLLAVLGFFGGIGILVYLVVWLGTPSEGDDTSPVEGLLGRGRSSMSPVTVLILGILAAVMFAFIVTDGFRAVLLGSAVLIGGVLLLNRNAHQGGPAPAPYPGGAPEPAQSAPMAAAATPYPPSGFPAPAPYPTSYPVPAAPVPAYPSAPGGAGAAPAAGYRAPFAPYGPYATRPSPYGPVPPPPPQPPAPVPPPPPKVRSRLGTVTFSMIFVVLGVVAVIDLTDVAATPPSAYFAAVLATIAVGLLVGAWFGRARWLIALGLVASAAVGISSLAESVTATDTQAVYWQPADYDQLAYRYETTFGDAVLDLRDVDFTDRQTEVTVTLGLGTLLVQLPPEVDVRAEADVKAGEAVVLGQRWSGFDQSPRVISDLGDDGAGGGELTLRVKVAAGDLEVVR
ncbi:PspC domain-containing protein [Solwaraspora sp. WMMA2101]|uniref:PspC domain-containing protein n=1 Tax=Solwaraspora sp. WMMA2101 TaxID=3404124 RepID=UPI003B93492C